MQLDPLRQAARPGPRSDELSRHALIADGDESVHRALRGAGRPLRPLLVELRASEERYRLLFDESPYLMWVVEAETLRFLEVNRKATGRYGYSRDEFLAMTLHDLRQPEEISGPLEEERAELTEEPRMDRGRHCTKAGELLEVSVVSR